MAALLVLCAMLSKIFCFVFNDKEYPIEELTLTNSSSAYYTISAHNGTLYWNFRSNVLCSERRPWWCSQSNKYYAYFVTRSASLPLDISDSENFYILSGDNGIAFKFGSGPQTLAVDVICSDTRFDILNTSYVSGSYRSFHISVYSPCGCHSYINTTADSSSSSSIDSLTIVSISIGIAVAVIVSVGVVLVVISKKCPNSRHSTHQYQRTDGESGLPEPHNLSAPSPSQPLGGIDSEDDNVWTELATTAAGDRSPSEQCRSAVFPTLTYFADDLDKKKDVNGFPGTLQGMGMTRSVKTSLGTIRYVTMTSPSSLTSPRSSSPVAPLSARTLHSTLSPSLPPPPKYPPALLSSSAMISGFLPPPPPPPDPSLLMSHRSVGLTNVPVTSALPLSQIIPLSFSQSPPSSSLLQSTTLPPPIVFPTPALTTVTSPGTPPSGTLSSSQMMRSFVFSSPPSVLESSTHKLRESTSSITSDGPIHE